METERLRVWLRVLRVASALGRSSGLRVRVRCVCRVNELAMELAVAGDGSSSSQHVDQQLAAVPPKP